MDKIDKTTELKAVLSGHYTVDYFQREYRWGRRQIEQMLSDFQGTFEEYYDYSARHDSPREVMGYGYYYLGCIICTKGSVKGIVDGQQRLTSLTLLLIYLDRLQRERGQATQVPLDSLVYSDSFGEKSFNLDVPDRTACMRALVDGDASYAPGDESSRNLLDRYRDIEDLFPDELKGDALPYFIYWLIEKVLLLEIDTPSEDEAHTIFLTMNDRGLSLNSAEMMKAYVIQHVAEGDRERVNAAWRENINRVKDASDADSSGVVNAQDVEFCSTWLRARYAVTMRETRKGARDEDYELLGDRFHSWVRDNAKAMGLARSEDYRRLVTDEMTRVAGLYLRMKQYGAVLTPGFEEVRYNAQRNLGYQTMLVIAAVRDDDGKAEVDAKIRMVSKFVDDYASTRLLNSKKASWNTNKYLLFRVMTEIRGKGLREVGKALVGALRRMDVGLEGVASYSLNRANRQLTLHFLARFTSYVNERMGNQPRYEEYTDRRKDGNSYDIEHILPDRYGECEDRATFDGEEDFERSRDLIGDLILLTRDRNRSYQDMPYTQKSQRYRGDNILAQSLNADAYANNPHLAALAEEYGLRPMPRFGKAEIAERGELYARLASDIWDPNAIKEIAGGWSDEEDRELTRNTRPDEFTVNYADRSWADAREYGFLSADSTGSGRRIRKIRTGDIVYCYVSGAGFTGIGECTSTAVPMGAFTVDMDGEPRPIMDVPWRDEQAKARLDPDREEFIGVKWIRAITDMRKAYKRKDMVSVPLAVYQLNDHRTYDMVRSHFGYNPDEERR